MSIVCNRCEKEIKKTILEYVPDYYAELCWYCHEYICYECWYEVGHCGHPEAEKKNEGDYRHKEYRIRAPLWAKKHGSERKHLVPEIEGG